MVKNLNDCKGVAPEEYLENLGDEWSDKVSFSQVLEDFFWPNLDTASSLVAELGSGGGRVASRIVTHVKNLHCFDISKEMLKKAESAVVLAQTKQLHSKPATFTLLSEPKFPNEDGIFDFVYAFDVFPHVDLHTQWRYYQEFFRIMKPGAKAIIHTANLEAPEGWARFAQQDKYSVGGFYFMVPSMVLTLIAKAGLTVITTSTQILNEKPDRHKNTYYNRDFMVLVQKP